MTIDYEPITPPGRLDTLRELRLPIDVLRWAPSWLAMKSGRAAQAAHGPPAAGFGAGPRSMRVMESFLRRRGHRASDWGLGLNTGDVKKLRAKLKHVVEESIAAHGEPVVLVGWSLGGYIAREYAREHPGEVRRVVTLGSPVIGGPRYTATAERYRSQGHDLAEIERAVANRYATPLRVPVIAIYSKRDGIVAWRACIDQWSPQVRHVEVSGAVSGLALNQRQHGLDRACRIFFVRHVAKRVEHDQPTAVDVASKPLAELERNQAILAAPQDQRRQPDLRHPLAKHPGFVCSKRDTSAARLPSRVARSKYRSTSSGVTWAGSP